MAATNRLTPSLSKARGISRARQGGFVRLSRNLARWGSKKWTPAKLFAGNKQGVWYDPSDFSTMFQDSAGTTPVTAVGQPVGLLLDKHQGATFATRVDVSGGFSNWQAAGTTLPTVNTNDSFAGSACVSGTFPVIASGGYLACRASGDLSSVPGNGAFHQIVQGQYARDTYEYALSRPLTGGEQINIYTTGSSGTNFLTLTSATQSGVWLSGSTSTVITANGGDYPVIYPVVTTAPVTVYLRRYQAQYIAGNHAIQATAANRPTLQKDANGLYYLAFNGTNSSMATAASVDFTGTAQMSVFTGVYKASDAAINVVTEFGNSSVATVGTFGVFAPVAASSTFGNRLHGTTATAAADASPYVAPVTAVLGSLFDLNGGINGAVTARVNGATITHSTSDPGATNFISTPLYVGARAASNSFFNGRLYSLIVRGAASSAAEIASAEGWVNGKTRAY